MGINLRRVYIQLMGFTIRKGWQVLGVKVAYLLPFYSAGLLYREYIEKIEPAANLPFFLIHYLLAFLYSFFFGTIRGYRIWSCTDFDSLYNPIIVPFFGIFFWVRVSKVLVPILKDSMVVKVIARNTYSIMTHQLVGFFIVNILWEILYHYGVVQNFEVNKARLTPYYIYAPTNNAYFLLLYLLFGIGIPLCISQIEKLFIVFLHRFIVFLYRNKQNNQQNNI